MTAIAILIGNASYTRFDDLPCCLGDVESVRLLLEALDRYDEIVVLTDVDADAMRAGVRSALEVDGLVSEVFFYFSGHGSVVAGDYFYCGTSFDAGRPNETGVSESELHQLFRDASPNLLVKVLDACESGTRLVKDISLPPPFLQKGLANVVQLASSLHDQDSFGGERLSRFTRAFCEAATRRDEGPVFYADIVNTLRDDFLNDEIQTPYFVLQGTARELFVEDAGRLKGFKATFKSQWSDEDETTLEESKAEISQAASPLSFVQKLEAAEARIATPVSAKALIDSVFDGVILAIGDDAFPELFTQETIEHRDFRESTATEFIARVMAKESRRDQFVHADVRMETPKRLPWESRLMGAFDMFNKDAVEVVELDLNCSLERVQLKITLTPKFQSLQRFVLVLTCAPSLEVCYVFEILTRHARSDWSSYAEEGREIVRRWYKLGWEQDSAGVVAKIRASFIEAVEGYIASVTDKLDGPN